MSDLGTSAITALASGGACTLLLGVYQVVRERRRDALQADRAPLVDEGLALGNAGRLTDIQDRIIGRLQHELEQQQGEIANLREQLPTEQARTRDLYEAMGRLQAEMHALRRQTT